MGWRGWGWAAAGYTRLHELDNISIAVRADACGCFQLQICVILLLEVAFELMYVASVLYWVACVLRLIPGLEHVALHSPKFSQQRILELKHSGWCRQLVM